MYGKLIDGILHTPNIIHIGDKVCYNPSSEIYESNGYMEVIDTPYPELIEGEAKHYESTYEEQDGKIVKTWHEVEKVEREEVNTPSIEHRISVLERKLNNTMDAVDFLLVGEQEGHIDDTIFSNEDSSGSLEV